MNCPRCSMPVTHLSKSCDSCGCDLRPSEALQQAPSEQSHTVRSVSQVESVGAPSAAPVVAPLQLDIDPGRCVAGASGSIGFRLVNEARSAMESVVRVVPQHGLRVNGGTEFTIRTPPEGVSKEYFVTFRTPEAGSPVIRFFVELESGPAAGEEFERAIVLHVPADQTPAHVTVRIGDEAGGDLTKLDRSGDTMVNIGSLTERHLEPSEWNRVLLQPSDGRKRFLTVRPDPVLRTDRLTLLIESGTSPRRSVCLLAGTRFTVGRGDDVDVTLRTSCHSDPNGNALARISRQHAVISVEADRWTWTDESTFGTNYAGQIFGGVDSGQLNSYSESDQSERNSFYFVDHSIRDTPISPGGLLNLIPEKLSAACSFNTYERAIFRQIGASVAQGCQQRSSVLLTRTDDLAGIEELVLLPAIAEIGDEACCSVRIPHVHGSVARILHMAGSFWLEALTETVPMTINGKQLELHHLAFLCPGHVLNFAGLQIVVQEFSQHIVSSCRCHPEPDLPVPPVAANSSA